MVEEDLKEKIEPRENEQSLNRELPPSTVRNWQTLSTEMKYDNNWIQVTEHQVIAPSGNPGLYGKVHMKSRALAIVPLDERGNTWLVGQQRYVLGIYSWEVPMGGGALMDSPIDAAKRELKEETGLTAERWTEIAYMHTSNSVTDEEGYAYIAQDLTEGETEFDETEDLAIKKLPIMQAIAMVLDGRITDAVSMIALLKVKHLIDTQQITFLKDPALNESTSENSVE